MKAKLLTLLFLIIFSQSYTQNKLSATKHHSKIDVNINGNLFTSYIFSQEEKYPFFFPVNGPSNGSVTSMRNAIYPHHSSLFFGCDKVNGGNYWQEEIERGQIISLRADILKSDSSHVVIENECVWRRPNAPSPIKDFRRITISVPSAGLYQIDFDVTMEMLIDVSILKTNHSLFSGRIDPDLAVINGGTMLNANGEKGEKETFGKKSGWIDCYNKRGNGKEEGIAIMQHPSNDGYPSPWFTRDYGFFSPTPMYWPTNEKSTDLKKGQTLKLRYRVLVHSGNTSTAKIAEQFEKYKVE